MLYGYLFTPDLRRAQEMKMEAAAGVASEVVEGEQ
jgi:hypothetical protein